MSDMLFRTPRLDEHERRVVEQIEELKRSLGYALGTSPKRWQGLLRRNSLARAVRGSNSIEGYNVTVDDAIAVAEGEAPLDATDEARAAVEGYQSAMTYVLQLADDPHFTYSPDLVRSLHFMMLQHDLSKHPGKWRPGPIYVHDDERRVVVYEAPDAALVPELVQELLVRLEATREPNRPPMVAAAMGHLNLVMIHPFSDGNGRMARCLQTLILARTGTLAPQFCSIEEYLGHNTRAYYDVLAEVGGGGWHPDRDARPWIRFCLTAHFRQAMTLLRRSRELSRLWNLVEEEVRLSGLPERVIYAVAEAALGIRVRNATYRGIAEVSEQIASRDLKSAVDAGFLIATGERRGRYYGASDRLRALREKTRETKSLEDPFDSRRIDDAPFLPGLENAR
jgi:Fic family protein